MATACAAPAKAFFRYHLVEARKNVCIVSRVAHSATRGSALYQTQVGRYGQGSVGSRGCKLWHRRTHDLPGTLCRSHRSPLHPIDFFKHRPLHTESTSKCPSAPLTHELLYALEKRGQYLKSNLHLNDSIGLPLLHLETYDAHRRQIRHAVEQILGPQRQSEFRRVAETGLPVVKPDLDNWSSQHTNLRRWSDSSLQVFAPRHAIYGWSARHLHAAAVSSSSYIAGTSFGPSCPVLLLLPLPDCQCYVLGVLRRQTGTSHE